jgi:hypothetical protein
MYLILAAISPADDGPTQICSTNPSNLSTGLRTPGPGISEECVPSSGLQMETACIFETPVPIHHIASRHIPEEANLQK